MKNCNSQMTHSPGFHHNTPKPLGLIVPDRSRNGKVEEVQRSELCARGQQVEAAVE